MIRIGWSSRDFTPRRPALIQGQMHRRIGREAMDALTVTALAIGGTEATDCAVLVSCDLATISDPLLRAVRSRLAALLPEVPSEKIVLFATHTHTSLVIEDGYYAHPGGDVMTPAECEAWVAGHAADAAAEAWRSRRPRLLGRAFGHAVVGHHRYALYADGHAQMYGKTAREDFAAIAGYEDHGLDVLFTWESDGSLAGLALAIPCPAQVDEGLERFSADFWHEVRLELRTRFGPALSVLPLCGAAGDQSPHFLLYRREEEEMRRRRGLTERQEIAQRVADAVERALQATTPPPGPDAVFAHQVRNLQLTPLQATPRDAEWARAEYERCVQRGDVDSWWPRRLRSVMDSAGGPIRPAPYSAEIHVMRLGDLAVAANPFELFLDYGLQIKARSPAPQTCVVQLAGRGWYLPTERALRGGGYGAMPAVCFVGPDGGRELVQETLQSLLDLFPGSA